MAGSQPGCVKTLTKIPSRKIDLIKRATSDDRRLGYGFGTPKFYAIPPNFEFSHNLQRNQTTTSTRFRVGQFHHFGHRSAAVHGDPHRAHCSH